MIAVNPLDLPLHRDTYLKRERLVIDNFLEEAYAEKLLGFLKTMPEDWWFASSWPNQNLEESMDLHRCAKVNSYYIERSRNAALHALDHNRFSYSFYRTNGDHHELCSCLYCEAARFIKSQTFLDFLNRITGLELTTVNECFANRYSGGSWLSTHSDDINGRLAFVYHLTKNWNASWGGLYVAHNSDGSMSVLPPTFNRLAIFGVGSNQTPHAVTPILPGVSQSRYAITGWIR